MKPGIPEKNHIDDIGSFVKKSEKEVREILIDLTPSIPERLVSEEEAGCWIFNGECNTLSGQVYQP
jgi:hypothetical protein